MACTHLSHATKDMGRIPASVEGLYRRQCSVACSIATIWLTGPAIRFMPRWNSGKR